MCKGYDSKDTFFHEIHVKEEIMDDNDNLDFQLQTHQSVKSDVEDPLTVKSEVVWWVGISKIWGKLSNRSLKKSLSVKVMRITHVRLKIFVRQE
eukprot:TRINITY_DN19104_c0_g2_i2.p1 TRINITY_DN19104_c0_g2~~TRINITY_DN19104_c0_g2_i2.p1  ORF type:complete len:110 (-),score=8.29 TRINITY_DN19104_c0_g2_i2:281-562(-)